MSGKDVLWFADRPRRDAGRLSAPGFFGDCAPLGFKKTAPNGALVESLSGCTEARPQLMAVEAQTLRQNFQEPIGFIAAEGQQLSIDQNQALYSLIGSSFEEGFSTTSFQLPDLQGPAGTSW